MERRAVLLLTAVPVLAGLILVNLASWLTGQPASGWIAVKCLLLFAAMLFGYRLAGPPARRTTGAVGR